MHFSLYHYSPAEYAAYDPMSRVVAQWLIHALRKHFALSTSHNINGIVPVIEHIGSTAIGVSGKGIIDIAMYLSPSIPESARAQSMCQSLENLSHAEKIELLMMALTKLNFVFEHGAKQFDIHRPRLDVTVVSEEKSYKVHCHLLVQGSIEQQKQRYFRQRLLMSPVLRHQYEGLKQQIVGAGITEHLQYGQAKRHFVKSILAELDEHLWSHTTVKAVT